MDRLRSSKQRGRYRTPKGSSGCQSLEGRKEVAGPGRVAAYHGGRRLLGSNVSRLSHSGRQGLRQAPDHAFDGRNEPA
jgi:hypothetical protein